MDFANEGAYEMVCDRSEQRTQQSQATKRQAKGAIAQLGERLLCKQEVGGSIPPGSTKPDERNHQCISVYAVVVFHWKNQSSLKIWEICIDV